MNTKLLTTVSALVLAGTLVPAPTVSADKPAKPSQSGVVERFETIGGHTVGPVSVDVDGVTLPIVVAVGWDDAVTLCTGGPPVFNGVEQDVVSPSGNFSAVVHNGDIPVLVFDVSAATSVPDFISKCAAGEINPLAVGSAMQRPIINDTGSAVNFKVKTRGVVTDAMGQEWTMQSFIKVRDVAGEETPHVLNEWVTLTAL